MHTLTLCTKPVPWNFTLTAPIHYLFYVQRAAACTNMFLSEAFPQAKLIFPLTVYYLANQLHGPTESNCGNSTVKIFTSEMRMPLSSQHYSIPHPPCFTVLHPKIFDLDRQKWKFRSRRSYVVGGRSPNT